VRERMHVALLEGRAGETPWGPRLGVRWWRFGAGVLLGLACATKWSGLYFILFFGVMTLAFDVAARRQYRVPRPWLGTLRRDLGPAAYALGLIPFGVYLASYAPWFASETAVNRHEVGNSIGPDSVLPIPDAFRSLWHYTHAAYRFHAGLTNAAGNHHPWESKPWTWPMGLRPMLYWYESGAAVPGCGGDDCVGAVMLVGTPALWWTSIPVLGFGTWRVLTRRDPRWVAVLVGYGAGFLPWFTNLDRQMYFFYMTPVAPFLVLATVLAMGEVLGRVGASAERRQTGLLVVSLYVGLVVANFVWLWPILTGSSITPEHWNAELWLPSWR